MEESCGNCDFSKEIVDNYVRCRRYPTGVRKGKSDWCGEWRLKNNKINTGTKAKKGKRADPEPKTIPEEPKTE